MTAERWSGLRRAGSWSYVLERPGAALEVVVYRVRPGRLRVIAAVVHELVPPENVPALIEELEPCCDLVGGACLIDGGVIALVLLLMDEHGRGDGELFEQPEAFWQGLERIFARTLSS